MLAVVISSAMTAVAGVFFAFYYNNLFPEQIFNISRSIEIILGPVIGGVGTLFGPILGAAVLTILADAITELLAAIGVEIPGVKQVFYGLVLLVVVMFLPARHLADDRAEARPGEAGLRTWRCSNPRRLEVLSRVARGRGRLVRRGGGRHRRPDRAERRRQDHHVQHGRGRLRARRWRDRFAGRRIDGLRPDQVCGAGIGRTFQIVQPFAGLSVLDNVIVGALERSASVAEARRSAPRSSSSSGSPRARPAGLRPHAAGPQAARGGAGACHAPAAAAPRRGDGGSAPDRVRPDDRGVPEINRRDGLTILLIEHVMRAVMALAQEIVVLHHGEVIARCAWRGRAGPGGARVLSRRGNRGMSAVEPLLAVEGLDLYYGDAQALAGVSLEVPAGEIVAIVGANGAGKSSLIRCIAGIEAPRRPHPVPRHATSAGSIPTTCSSASARWPRAARSFRRSRWSRTSRWARCCLAPRGAHGRTLADVYALFPRLAERKRKRRARCRAASSRCSRSDAA